jgi:hypothetical protein
MIDLTQAITILILLTLSGMLLVIGYQVVKILQEVRKSAQTVNHILDNADRVSQSIANPIVNLSGLFTGLKGGAQLVSLFTKKKSPEPEKEE